MSSEPKITKELIEVLERYEQWEANLFLDNKAWVGSTAVLTDNLFEELMEIQEERNTVLAKIRN